MYNRHYGFLETPFNLTPDPKYLYLSESHKEALASLIYGIKGRKGFVAVLGEVGTGKTTLLRYLLGQLDRTIKTVFIFNTNVTFGEMLRVILRDLGVRAEGVSKTELIEAFNSFLLAELREGRTVAIVIDEAQNLTPTVLEELRLLSNLETAKAKLLQIVLVGQPELGRTLARYRMRQIRQRIGLVCSLEPLSLKDTEAYINRRLHVAGYRGKPIFTKRAIATVWKRSEGIPRLINSVCDNALIMGYGSNLRRIGAGTIKAAVDDFEQSLGRAARWPVRPRWWPRMAIALILLVLSLGIGLVLSGHSVPRWNVWPPPEGEDRPPIAGQTLSPDFDGGAEPEGRTPVTGRPSQPSDEFGGRESPAALPTEESGKPPLPASWSQAGAAVLERPGGTPNHIFGTVTVRQGDHLARLASSVYGETTFLTLDLIKSLNREIQDIDVIVVGQVIRFPELSPTTLVHRTAEGKYVAHSTTVSSMTEATQLQALFTQRGYTVSVVPTRVSPRVRWYRVLVGDFEDPERAVEFSNSLQARKQIFQ